MVSTEMLKGSESKFVLDELPFKNAFWTAEFKLMQFMLQDDKRINKETRTCHALKWITV